MSENIKYIEIPSPKNGQKPTVFYDEDSLPLGMSLKDISELVKNKQKIPYVEGKGNAPSIFYTEINI